MYADCDSFLSKKASQIAQDAMNVTDSLNIEEREFGGITLSGAKQASSLDQSLHEQAKLSEQSQLLCEQLQLAVAAAKDSIFRSTQQ